MPEIFDYRLHELMRGAGCVFVRPGSGGHEIWQCPNNGRRFAVPIRIVSLHTAACVLGQIGLAGSLPARRSPRPEPPSDRPSTTGTIITIDGGGSSRRSEL